MLMLFAESVSGGLPAAQNGVCEPFLCVFRLCQSSSVWGFSGRCRLTHTAAIGEYGPSGARGAAGRSRSGPVSPTPQPQTARSRHIGPPPVC